MPHHDPSDKIGFACRACGAPTEVKDSRPVGAGETVRRRRHCTGCDNRVTTFEVIGMRSSDIDAQLAVLNEVRTQLVQALGKVERVIDAVALLGDLGDLRYRAAAEVLSEIRRIDE